ncbi:hypothetical protein JDV02_009234 [Purpureocillium takamizusanense]|uniref:Uncharacterized protein n=1 Tax=Purpureocillium takamizusanense TaxID=2060973 RepID=A0A9Q8QRG4_9HYPO|nr:uncharacterized protein JDV02_009234 [Purpureocillium takamizusanense]UNI23414.1 hypothetical protein JDV02_009234 [Purpureocillium takamizusanense]
MILGSQSKPRPSVGLIHTGAFTLKAASYRRDSALQDEVFWSPGPARSGPSTTSREHDNDSVMQDKSPVAITKYEASESAATISPTSPDHPRSEPSLTLPRIEDLHVQDKGSDDLAQQTPIIASPMAAGTLAYRRRQVVKPLTASARNLYFQRFREGLWRRGSQDFGNCEHADVFVSAAELRRLSGATNGDVAADKSQLSVRVVIHSKDRSPRGLKREFDLVSLRATIPEPLASPRSPNFDRASLLSVLDSDGATSPCESPVLPPAPGRVSDERKDSSQRGPGPPADRRHHCAGWRPVPMHLQYARSHLPVLAAIMMSEQVRKGDVIELPLPHPRAWAETVAFVYTGEEELLTEHVKRNIVYLGGKV